MTVLINLIILLVGTYLLGEVTKKIISKLEHYTRLTHLTQFAATAFIIALATSLPELMVSISSSLNGLSQLAYGNAIGSNIANISIIIGITAVFARVLPFHHNSDPKKLFSPLFLSFVPIIMALDGIVSRLDGIILLIIYIYYLKNIFSHPKPTSPKLFRPRPKLISRKSLPTLISLLFWILILILVSQLVIIKAQFLALYFGFSITFIGFFIIAVGTSLPELVFSLRAIKKHHPGMVTASIIGSCVTNATLIIGISAIIQPIIFTGQLGIIYLSGLEYFFILSLFILFISTKKRLESWEGIILILIFVYYSNLELLIK